MCIFVYVYYYIIMIMMIIIIICSSRPNSSSIELNVGLQVRTMSLHHPFNNSTWGSMLCLCDFVLILQIRKFFGGSFVTVLSYQLCEARLFPSRFVVWRRQIKSLVWLKYPQQHQGHDSNMSLWTGKQGIGPVSQ